MKERRKTSHPRRRAFRRFVVIAALLVALAFALVPPLQGLALQAFLLGPDSLFPVPVARTVQVNRHGRAISVPIVHGVVWRGLAFRSPALNGRSESFDLYLPPGYDSPANRARRYPTLYLLHGAPGQPSDWIDGMHVQLIEDQDIASGAMPPLIIVMPEGNGGLWRDSQYVDTRDGFRAEQLIAHDIVRYIDRHYRTIADRRARAIAGISEGGYGAMNLGLKHRDVFSIVVSISGYFAANPDEVLIGNDPWHGDRALMQANSPSSYVRQLSGFRSTHILIMDNTSDGGYTNAAIDFARVLRRRRIPCTLVLSAAPYPLAAHFWPYWRDAFPKALLYIGRNVMTPSTQQERPYAPIHISPTYRVYRART